jgi:hypothetical protein
VGREFDADQLLAAVDVDGLAVNADAHDFVGFAICPYLIRVVTIG